MTALELGTGEECVSCILTHTHTRYHCLCVNARLQLFFLHSLADLTLLTLDRVAGAFKRLDYRADLPL